MTDKWLQALQSPQDGLRVDHLDAIVPGLSLRVSARNKIWAIRYRRGDGSRTREVLGRYPVMGLAAARAAARDLLAAANSQPNASQASGSLRAMVTEALAEMRREGKGGTAGDYQWLLLDTEGAAVPFLEDRCGPAVPASAITPTDVTAWLASLKPRGVSLLTKGRTYLSAVYGRGMKLDYDPSRPVEAPVYGVTANPATPVRAVRPVRAGVGDRVVTDDELKDAWYGLAARADPWTVGTIRLIVALGGLRVTEVLRARWANIEEVADPAGDLTAPPLRLYRLPSTKAGLRNAVPIGPHAWAELNRLRPLSDGAPLWIVSDHTGEDGGVVPRSPGSTAHAIRRWCERRRIKPRWSPRDLRRTVKTQLRDRGVDEEALRLWMGHGQTQGVDRKHYDRAEYLGLKRTAVLPALTAWLEDVVGPAAAGVA